MAETIIPALPQHVLSALAHVDGTKYLYSTDIADTLESELAAMLRVGNQIYAIWQSTPATRIVQPADHTIWLLDDEGPSIDFVAIELDDAGEIQRFDVGKTELKLIR
jgi:hypothetical protein